jgi:hypothetical protein
MTALTLPPVDNVFSTLPAMTPTETALYLRTLPAIRERCTRVLDLATQNKLQYFEYYPENEHAVTDFCVQIIHVSLLLFPGSLFDSI